ncbi:Hypothetical protein NGAL_HAMBI1145_57380 [Neorhizobium galegae bv. officinalis]|uniref:Uncharacterized protein n=1 Tax=Neorhizobium galegae bv. officinalis TaxID=323656 RepID=A0A0T7G1L4_NEOGA|nr:Hypothetical protein NGAL_HAMBI1145_57380 [Neorhizobium galegae bv. officinalis]CDZ53517.1 Hypothetical protein NGAL_HAMBI1189_50330 [Neorhizobium galegae bv. officinalis]
MSCGTRVMNWAITTLPATQLFWERLQASESNARRKTFDIIIFLPIFEMADHSRLSAKLASQKGRPEE